MRFSFQLSTFNFNLYLGGYSAEVPPLPIPNRVVKLSIADGTALRCGRVGSRHFQKLEEKSSGFFVFVAMRSTLLYHWGPQSKPTKCLLWGKRITSEYLLLKRSFDTCIEDSVSAVAATFKNSRLFLGSFVI